MKIEYKASVERDLRRIDKKEVNRILKKIEKVLNADPDKGLPLKGDYTGLYKLRVGDYRVVYSKSKNRFLVLRIRHRKKAY